MPPVFLDEVSSFRILEEGGNIIFHHRNVSAPQLSLNVVKKFDVVSLGDGVHSLSVECIDTRSVLFCKGESDSIMFLNGLRRALRMTAKPDHQPGPANNDA